MTLLEKMINFQLSRKAKEAIKVALAFSIAYLFALQTGWLSPFWAGLTVGQIALFPNAQSLRNGALRLAGLVPAVLVAILIFALAGQDRWLFVSMASCWMMLATYLMIKDQKRSYMWNVAGFVTFIFLTAAQTKIFTLLVSQNDSLEDKNLLRLAIKQELLLLNGLKQSFFAKGAETYEVQEAAEFWKEFHHLSAELGESFSRLNNSISGLENIELYRLIPELDKYSEVINQRFKLAGDILEKGNREFKTKTIRLSVDKTYFASLKPFDQLAFISSRNEFEKTEQLSRKILRCANNIMDEWYIKKKSQKKYRVAFMNV